MSIVTITLSNKNFDLYCPEENKQALLDVAEKLDSEIKKMRLANPSASFELLLVMTALNLQDERQSKEKGNHDSVLQESRKEFHNLLSSVYSELKLLADKFK
jgi:cell division protein ZapA